MRQQFRHFRLPELFPDLICSSSATALQAAPPQAFLQSGQKNNFLPA